MEQLNVFFRIFHADLIPTQKTTPEQLKEYHSYIEHYADFSGVIIPKEISALDDLEVRFYYYKVLFCQTVKEIEAALYQKVFVQGESEEAMRREVIKLQRYINMQLFKLKQNFIPETHYEKMNSFSENKDAIDIYKLAYHSLEDLHEYLETTFQYYLDEHIVVPDKKRKRFIREQSPEAKKALLHIKQFNIHRKLGDQVGSTIERFLNDGFNGFTYAQMHYCAKLNEVLNKFFDYKIEANQENFIFLLIQINFNRNGALLYILEIIREQLSQENNFCDQLEVLLSYKEKVKRIQHPNSFAYNEKLLSLRHQLLDWLNHEIEAASLKNIEVRDFNKVQSKEPELELEKHKVNLSVSESALLLRILSEVKVIEAPKKQLFKYFSKHFRTHQSTEVSVGSLDKKYYAAGGKSFDTLREVLHKCMEQLDQIEAKQV